MRQQYAIRSMILAAGLVLAGLAVIVQMIRIQTSEQAQGIPFTGRSLCGRVPDVLSGTWRDL